MTRLTATIFALWVWAFSAHAQIAPEQHDSINEAVASSLYAMVAPQFGSIPPATAADGFLAGAGDSTAVGYSTAVIIGNGALDWITKEFGGGKIGVVPSKVMEIVAGYIGGNTPAFTELQAKTYLGMVEDLPLGSTDERHDSINEALASSIYPVLASQLGATPPAIAAKGFAAGAADSTAVGYATSVLIGNRAMEAICKEFARTEIGVDPQKVMEIVAGYIAGKTPAFTEMQANNYISEQFVRSLNSGIPDKADPVAEEAFLAAAASQKGAVVLPDSVVVVVEKQGKKDMPEPGSTVTVVYEASLSNGTVFDTTDSQPIDLSFDSLAPGVRSGLRKIGKGGAGKIYVPASAAYGSEGFAGVIPGGASLLFDIKLIDIK